jgi:hypothetical protein
MNIHVILWPVLLGVCGCAGIGGRGDASPAAEGSHEGASIVKVGQTAFEGGVRVNFKRTSNQGDILVTIAWEANLGGEYSQIGPVRSLVVEEGGKVFKTVRNWNLREIEDIDLKSIGLRSDEVGKYEVSMAWGAGESLHDAHVLWVE